MAAPDPALQRFVKEIDGLNQVPVFQREVLLDLEHRYNRKMNTRKELQEWLFETLKYTTDVPTTTALLKAWERFKAAVGKNARKKARAPTLANLPMNVVKAHIEPHLSPRNLARLSTVSKGTKAVTNGPSDGHAWPALHRAMKDILLTSYKRVFRRPRLTYNAWPPLVKPVGIPGRKNHFMFVRASPPYDSTRGLFDIEVFLMFSEGRVPRWRLSLLSFHVYLNERGRGMPRPNVTKHVHAVGGDRRVEYYEGAAPGSPHMPDLSNAELNTLLDGTFYNFLQALRETENERRRANLKGEIESIRENLVRLERDVAAKAAQMKQAESWVLSLKQLEDEYTERLLAKNFDSFFTLKIGEQPTKITSWK